MRWRRAQEAKGLQGGAAEQSERRVPAGRPDPGPKPAMARAEEKRLHRVPLARKRSWPAALLGASILSSCFLLTQSQRGSSEKVPVTQKPLNPMEGRDVTLTPGGGMEKVVSCSWYRGRTPDLSKLIFAYYLPPSTLGQIAGFAHTGRETGAPDCSLHIRNLTSADSGNYTVTKEGGLFVIGYAAIEVSVDNAMVHTCAARDPASSKPTETPPTTNDTILWIIFGCLAGTLVLIGILLLFFLRARRRRDGTSSRTITPLSLLGILSSSGQVKPANSAVSNIYQTLEPGSQAVYDDLNC